MPQSLSKVIIHIIFSTKDRLPHIDTDLKPVLLPYMGGIIREMGGKALSINGMADHVHILMALPPTIAVATAVPATAAPFRN